MQRMFIILCFDIVIILALLLVYINKNKKMLAIVLSVVVLVHVRKSNKKTPPDKIQAEFSVIYLPKTYFTTLVLALFSFTKSRSM